MEDFFQDFLKFTYFKLHLEEKLKFEQILVQNLLNSGLYLEKYFLVISRNNRTFEVFLWLNKKQVV